MLQERKKDYNISGDGKAKRSVVGSRPLGSWETNDLQFVNDLNSQLIDLTKKKKAASLLYQRCSKKRNVSTTCQKPTVPLARNKKT